MRVSDIFSEAKTFIGNCDNSTVFELLSDALELLNNKGEFDVLKAYVDLQVTSSNIVTLPGFVETPLKAAIGGIPSFSRDRLYEFSMNGPGTTATRTTFGWEDRGFVPTLAPPTIPVFFVLVGPDITGDDLDKTITFRGLDENSVEITQTVTISDSAYATMPLAFTKLLEVVKDVTAHTVSIVESLDGVAPGNLLSTYQPEETEGKYRQIRLSDSGETVRLLVRRKTLRVSSLEDFIPVQSRMGLLMMLKAVLNYRRGDQAALEMAMKYESEAARIASEAQRSITAYIDLAKDTEKDMARGLHLANRDSAIVADIYDEVAEIVGPVGSSYLFAAITEGLEALNNKGHWDGLTGYADIFTDGNQYVTLPRYIESPIAINLGGRPMTMRNKWFEFHLNGPGSDTNVPVHHWDWVGDVCTIKPLEFNVQLVVLPEDNSDDNKTVTIFGLDENSKPLGHGNGIILPVDHTKTLPLTNDTKISRIDRITRDATAGFVNLLGYSVDQTQSVQLGFWYPDETEPQYTRIRMPTWSNWIRLRYRKRTLKVDSLTDSLHLKNRTAIILMIKALVELGKPQPNFEIAQTLEAKAVQFLEEEQRSRNPAEVFNIQIDCGSFAGSNYILV